MLTVRVIIPAYNEAGSLERLLPRLPVSIAGYDIRPLVVSDGSTDDSAATAAHHGVEVLDLDQNRGKGAAVQAGLDAVAQESFVALVIMDADGQHDPADLASLVAPLIAGAADVAIGSRYITDRRRGSAPLNRYLVRLATVIALRRLLGVTVTDPYCGYRGFTRKALDTISFDGERYQGELEALFDAHQGGLSVIEVPVQKIYNGSCSKMSADGGRLLGRFRVIRQYVTTIWQRRRMQSAADLMIDTGTDTDADTPAAARVDVL